MRLFLLGVSYLSTTVVAASSSSVQSNIEQLESFRIDPVDVLNNLDDYQAVWIKPHGCVWSECAIDDTDDKYMGDNRDGDEQWYQYRTQKFCANAAYSLYAAKKGTSSWFGCSRSHFVDSFFTYGGADNLLQAVGKSPTGFYVSGDNYNNSASTANSICVAIDLDDERRELNSHDKDNQAEYVSTLGCDSDGSYAIAGFEASECDGNYFKEILDPFDKYNKQHDSIGCHLMWGQNKKKSTYQLEFLLSNSWSCDINLYPYGCPDPYGEKERVDYAIRTVNRGGNAQRVYKNMAYKRPLRMTSWSLVVLATVTLVAAYLIRNRDRIHSKGGRPMGLLRCVLEDIIAQGIAFRNGMKRAVRAQREQLRETRKRRRAKKKGVEDDGVWMGPTPMEEVDASESSSKRAHDKKRRKEKRRQRKQKEAKSRAESSDFEGESTDENPQWAEDDQDDRQVV